jgi:hypothetical protein
MLGKKGRNEGQKRAGRNGQGRNGQAFFEHFREGAEKHRKGQAEKDRHFSEGRKGQKRTGIFREVGVTACQECLPRMAWVEAIWRVTTVSAVCVCGRLGTPSLEKRETRFRWGGEGGDVKTRNNRAQAIEPATLSR